MKNLYYIRGRNITFLTLLISLSCFSVWGQQGYVDGVNCGWIGGWVYDGSNNRLTVDVYADGVKVLSKVANEFRQDLQNAGIGDGSHGYMFYTPDCLKNGQNHNIIVKVGSVVIYNPNSPSINCAGSGAGCGTAPTPTPTPAPTTGSLAFQIVSYDCTSGFLEYKMTGGDGSTIYLEIPGLFAGNVSANTVANSTFYPDGRIGRTLTGYAVQPGNRINISFTTGCNLSPTTSAPAPTPTPTPAPVTNANYQGYLDVANCNVVAGWAFDMNHNQQSISVDVYVNGHKAATVLANQSRPDVAQAFGVNGYSQYGFSWTLPDQYKTGASLTISVKYAGTSSDVGVSPKVIPGCFGLTGNFDFADCYGIGGWLINTNASTSPAKFDVYVNGYLAAANVAADADRQDISDRFGTTGYTKYGFAVPFTSRFRQGVPLTISVKYAGTLTHIPGSPKVTASCPADGSNNADNATRVTTSGNDFWEWIGGLIARCQQTSLPGSPAAISSEHSRSGPFALKLQRGKPTAPNTLTTQLIRVSQGKYYSLEAYAYSPKLSGTNYGPQLTKAIAGGIVAGLVLNQQSRYLPDQGTGNKNETGQAAAMLGVSAGLTIPLVKALIQNQLPQAGLDLAFYNKRGQFVYRQRVDIDRTARQDWQQLTIEGRAPEDGYIMIRLRNQSKIPVWFDDIQYRASSVSQPSGAEDGVFMPALSHRKRGFATTADLSTESVYNASSCGGGNGVVTIFGGWLDEVVVKAPKPEPAEPPKISQPQPTPTGGGTGGPTGPTSETITAAKARDRAISQTFARKFSSVCDGLRKMWEWSYQNNNRSTTVEMAGYVLADGSFISLPFDGNTGISCHFMNDEVPFLGADGYRYSVFIFKTGPNAGKPYIRKESLLGAPYIDIEIKAYAHTHPWDDGRYDEENPTKETDSQKFGDWQLSKEFNIPGIIISSEKLTYFHYDSQAVDDDKKRLTDKKLDFEVECPSPSRGPKN